jgi:membrane associated rhomboid family serine protease
MIAAYLVLFPGATLGTLAPVLFLHVVENTPALVLLLVWVITQLLSGVASLTTTTSVAWWAHVGGFLTGLAFAIMFRPARARRR